MTICERVKQQTKKIKCLKHYENMSPNTLEVINVLV